MNDLHFKLTENEDEEKGRATDFRNDYVPGRYDRDWPRFATSRDLKNPRHKRNRGPNPIKKLTDDLNKMLIRIEKEKNRNRSRSRSRSRSSSD